MKIKKISIHGFKSFVDKVTLTFPAGTSGIIGPNGCGKSNIVDAIRWVLGEQNARHLRGKHMEDIIFNGSESRKPLGMAEVVLTFSNEDGLASARFANFSEIEISRRLYRSGESEYYINKVQSRLKDIVDLFTDTGIGTRAYSIIEQGQVGWLDQRQGRRAPRHLRRGRRHKQVQAQEGRRPQKARVHEGEPHPRQRHNKRGQAPAQLAQPPGQKGREVQGFKRRAQDSRAHPLFPRVHEDEGSPLERGKEARDRKGRRSRLRHAYSRQGRAGRGD